MTSRDSKKEHFCTDCNDGLRLSTTSTGGNHGDSEHVHHPRDVHKDLVFFTHWPSRTTLGSHGDFRCGEGASVSSETLKVSVFAFLTYPACLADTCGSRMMSSTPSPLHIFVFPRMPFPITAHDACPHLSPESCRSIAREVQDASESRQV